MDLCHYSILEKLASSAQILEGRPFDEMESRGSLHNAADLAWLQGKGGILKLLLHVAAPEEAPAA
jgi:hypothetical protein